MIRVAVLGCGYWGKNILRVFDSLEGCELRMACDPRPETLARAYGRSDAFRTTGDVNEVFGASDIDAVAICTPVDSHYSLARDALLAGKHVFVEKPMTHSLESAQDLAAVAEQTNLVLMVDHTFVYSGAVRKIRSIIETGDIGRLHYFDSVRINLGLFQPDVNVLWDLAAHDVSILLHLVDFEPQWVSAVGATHYGNFENQAYVTIGFEQSFLSHIHVNWLAPVKLRSTVIGGSRRMIVYNDLEPSESVRVYERGVTFNNDPENRAHALVDYRLGDMFAPHVEKTEPLARGASSFRNAIVQGTPTDSDGEAGVRVIRILEAAQRSMQSEGRRLHLEEFH